MNKRFAGLLTVLFTLALALALQVGLWAERPAPTDAATVVGYQSVTVFDGATVYTTTTYSDAYLVGSFGEVVMQVNNDISGSTGITVTPQFSSEFVGCGAVADWVDASYSAAYGTSSLSYGTVDVRKVVTGDDAEMLRFPVSGRCMRIKIQTAANFTPTVYLWMVNTQ